MRSFLVIGTMLLLASCVTTAKQNTKGECLNEDFVNRVSAAGHCIVVNTYASVQVSARPRLIAFVHGDGLSNKGEKYVTGFLAQYPDVDYKNAIFVALTRPGYSNGKEGSSGQNYYYEGDAYRSHTVAAVSNAIMRLQKHYKAGKLIVIGHSGGASILANSLGVNPSFKPDVAILLSGNYDTEKWARQRGFSRWHQGRGLSPIDQIQGVSKEVEIIALTGEDDSNTYPKLAIDYVAELKRIGKNATYISVPDTGHNDILRNRSMWASLKNKVLGN